MVCDATHLLLLVCTNLSVEPLFCNQSDIFLSLLDDGASRTDLPSALRSRLPHKSVPEDEAGKGCRVLHRALVGENPERASSHWNDPRSKSSEHIPFC